jgi:hypothetical protein
MKFQIQKFEAQVEGFTGLPGGVGPRIASQPAGKAGWSRFDHSSILDLGLSAWTHTLKQLECLYMETCDATT